MPRPPLPQHEPPEHIPPEHIAEEDLEFYAMGRLAPQDVVRVEAHLIKCRDCCLRLVRDQRFIELLRGAIDHEATQVQARAPDALVVMRSPTEDGGEGVLLALRQDAFVELYNRPWPGVILRPEEARLLAARLQLLAAEIDCRIAKDSG
jgi:hypothetical protein